MNQEWSLRGHLNPISTVAEHRTSRDPNTQHESVAEKHLVTTDDHGWIIVWNTSLRTPKYVWKGHDKVILSSFIVDGAYLITHSKDSEIKIWDLTPQNIQKKGISSAHPKAIFNELSYLTDDCGALLKEYPIPSVESIPVNSLNFCKIDYHEGTLLTPSTVDSNCFDVYVVDVKNFGLTRLLHNVDAHKLYKKATNDDIEEINPDAVDGKRDGFGIVMVFKFVDHNRFYVGYESGHLVGFNITYPSARSITATNSRSVIAKDASLDIFYVNDFHSPNPVLSVESNGASLFAGSTSKYISIHDLHEPTEEKDIRTINVKNGGIQSIQAVSEKLVLGFWNGVVKVYDPSFQLLSKHQVTLPTLQNFTDLTSTAKPIETNLKLSVLKRIDLATPGPKSKYKALVQKRRSELILVGYNDGKLMAFEL